MTLIAFPRSFEVNVYTGLPKKTTPWLILPANDSSSVTWVVTILILTGSIHSLPLLLSSPEPQTQVTNGSNVTVYTCEQVCQYEEWFSRAHCDNRQLDQIPVSRGCEEATLLELQSNSIKHIKFERISGYTYVRTLDLSRNKITVVVSKIFVNNPNLQNILLTGNSLDTLCNGVFNGTERKLLRLYLQDNKIEILEANAFRGLGHITTLYLSSNRLTHLPSSIFYDLKDLKHLCLMQNNIVKLRRHYFRGLHHLESLTLQRNHLRKIPQGLFHGLQLLTEVNLSKNELIHIPSPGNLGLHPHMIKLDLSNNNLTNSSMFVPFVPFMLNTTYVVYLHDNPFTCDCYFNKLQEKLHNLSVYVSLPLNCFHEGISYGIHDNSLLLCNEHNVVSTSSSSLLVSTTAFPEEEDVSISQFTKMENTFQVKQHNDVISTRENINIRNNNVVYQSQSYYLIWYIATVLTFLLVTVITLLVYLCCIFPIKTESPHAKVCNCHLSNQPPQQDNFFS